MFAKKSRNIINVISGISMVVVAFVTAAMICVMSAFNGIEDLVQKLFSNFDAPLTIVPVEGKMIADSLVKDSALYAIPGVAGFSRVIEEDAWINHAGYNTVATLKGVDTAYTSISTIDSMIYRGKFKLEDDSFYYAVVGLGIRSELAIPSPGSEMPILNVNAPIRGRKLSRYKENAFNRDAITISGIFSVNAELDAKFVFVPLPFARSLFGMEDACSSIELALLPGYEENAVRDEVLKRLPAGLEVKTRFDKNALVYQTNASEKWATFLILLFIVIIACFNIIASLTMLILEKKNDIAILHSMGSTAQSVRRIFIFEGIFINLIGGASGLLVGLAVCLGQQYFGWIQMDGAMVESYPVLIKPFDVAFIFIAVVTVGVLFSTLLVPALVKRFAE